MSSHLNSQHNNTASPLKLASKRNDAGDTTALLYAAREGDVEAIKALVAEGADVESKDGDGWTALIVAIVKGHLEAARALLDEGADVRARNNNGWTALRYAVSMDDTEAVRLLLEKGADADDKDAEGNTALMQAAGEKSIESISLLLAYGADAGMKNHSGETALSIASRQGYPEIVQMLNEGGAADATDLSRRTNAGELFSEGELQQLIEQIDDMIPERSDALLSLDADETDPSELEAINANTHTLDVLERLADALAALRPVEHPSAGAPRISITDMAHKLMLSLPEAAALSGLSRRHLRQAMRDGALRSRKIGQGWRIKRADLEAYVEQL